MEKLDVKTLWETLKEISWTDDYKILKYVHRQANSPKIILPSKKLLYVSPTFIYYLKKHKSPMVSTGKDMVNGESDILYDFSGETDVDDNTVIKFVTVIGASTQLYNLYDIDLLYFCDRYLSTPTMTYIIWAHLMTKILEKLDDNPLSWNASTIETLVELYKASDTIKIMYTGYAMGRSHYEDLNSSILLIFIHYPHILYSLYPTFPLDKFNKYNYSHLTKPKLNFSMSKLTIKNASSAWFNHNVWLVKSMWESDNADGLLLMQNMMSHLNVETKSLDGVNIIRIPQVAKELGIDTSKDFNVVQCGKLILEKYIKIHKSPSKVKININDKPVEIVKYTRCDYDILVSGITEYLYSTKS